MEKVGCEFVALALQNEVGPDVRWHYAAGNLNDKYKRITVRFGKGIAGKNYLKRKSDDDDRFSKRNYRKSNRSSNHAC